jgi:hypothetical protein
VVGWFDLVGDRLVGFEVDGFRDGVDEEEEEDGVLGPAVIGGTVYIPSNS